MADYDDAFARATERRPFANGTEGFAWEANWCGRCSKNNEATELWCPLLSVAYLGRTPVEWIDQTTDGTHYLGDTYHCTQFEERRDGNDEPEPDPEPPVIDGQVDMFEVFTDQIIAEVEQAPRPVVTHA